MESPELAKLQKQLSKITEQIIRIQDGGVYCDDLYEYLNIACTKAMDEKYEDAMKYSYETIKRISAKDETLQKILEFFEGKNTKEKKAALNNYLKEHPSLRTTDMQLLLQRIKLGKKYGEIFAQRPLPQTPIKDAIDELKPNAEDDLLD